MIIWSDSTVRLRKKFRREEYDATIAEPLRKIFKQRQWWHVHEMADGEKRVQTLAIHFVALIRGMPLKIRPMATPYQGDTPGAGPIQSRNEASVDSELSVLGLFHQANLGCRFPIHIFKVSVPLPS